MKISVLYNEINERGGYYMSISFEKSRRIRDIVEDFRNFYSNDSSDTDLTIDMKRFLSMFSDITIQEEQLEDKLCNLSYDEKEEKYNIKLSKDVKTHSLNFTLAHEMGHIILHKDILKSGEEFSRTNYDYNPESIYEREADQYAAELLMPYNKCLEILESHKWDIEKAKVEISKKFNVSLSSAKTRSILIRAEETINR